jgi:hypothetical protein
MQKKHAAGFLAQREIHPGGNEIEPWFQPGKADLDPLFQRIEVSLEKQEQ